jgi:hypothetical protein
MHISTRTYKHGGTRQSRGESSWEHPLDAYYRFLFAKMRKLRKANKSLSNRDSEAQRAKDRELIDLLWAMEQVPRTCSCTCGMELSCAFAHAHEGKLADNLLINTYKHTYDNWTHERFERTCFDSHVLRANDWRLLLQVMPLCKLATFAKASTHVYILVHSYRIFVIVTFVFLLISAVSSLCVTPDLHTTSHNTHLRAQFFVAFRACDQASMRQPTFNLLPRSALVGCMPSDC